jgi:sterol desaturase/sphingolipid hydroxylase (fatty acid hydroxylase superfamily)
MIKEKKDPTCIYFLLVGNTVCLTYLLGNHSINIHTESFHFVYSPLRFLFYILWIEGVFYAIHRLLHTQPFYTWIHKKHHENYDIYPADAFHLSPIETTLIVLNQNLPFFIVSFTFQEYLLIQCLYFTVEYLSHTNVFFEHHAIHHRYYKWNYCVCIPIFDWIFQTYKHCPKIRV